MDNFQLNSLGALSSVYPQSIIRQKNIDYLQYLCTYCQTMPLNHIWYQKQTNQNKNKLLYIYQLAINYSHHLENSYIIKKKQMQKAIQIKKAKIYQKKEAIKQHKNQVTRQKDKLKLMRLNKNKNAYAHQLQKMKELHQLYQLQKNKNNQLQNQIDPILFAQWQAQQMQQIYLQNVHYQPNDYYHNKRPSNSPSHQYLNNGNSNYPPQYQNHNNFNYNKNQRNNNNQNNQSDILNNTDQQNNNHIQHSNIIFKNQDVLKNNNNNNSNNIQHQSSETMQLRQHSKGNTYRSSKSKHQKNNSSSINNSQINDTIGDLNMESIRHGEKDSIVKKMSSVTGKQSELMYDKNLDSINNLHLTPESKNNKVDLNQIKEATQLNSMEGSKNSDIFKQGKQSKRIQINDDPSQNTNLFSSNMGSKNKKNKPLFGGKFQSKIKDQSMQQSTEYNLYNSNQGNVIGKPHINENQENSKIKQSEKKSNIRDSSKFDLNNSNQGVKDNKFNEQRFTTQSQRNLVIAVFSPNDKKQKQNKVIDQEQKYQDDFDDFDEIPQNSQLNVGQKDKNIEKSNVNIQVSDDQANKSISSLFVSLKNKQFVPLNLKKGTKQSISSYSMIGSLKQHTMIKKTQAKKKNDEYTQSYADNDDFLNDLIEIPQQSIVARPSKLHQSTRIKNVKSKVLPSNMKRNNLTMSHSVQQKPMQDSSKPKQKPKPNSKKEQSQISMADSLQLKEKSNIIEKSSEMLLIPGSQIRQKQIDSHKPSLFKPQNKIKSAGDKQKDPDLKIHVDLVSSHTIDEKLLPKQNQLKRQSKQNIENPIHEEQQIDQMIDLDNQQSGQQQKQDVQMKLLSLIRQNPSKIAKQKIIKYDNKWIQNELLSTVKKNINQIQQWTKIQQFYQRQANAMKSELQKKRQLNKNIPKQKIIQKLKQRKPSFDDDLTYSRSMMDPLSHQASGLVKRQESKKSTGKSKEKQQSDIQVAIKFDSKQNSFMQIPDLNQDSKMDKKQSKNNKSNDKQKLSQAKNSPDVSKQQRKIQKPSSILEKMQERHKYDVQNPLDNAILDNKSLFKGKTNQGDKQDSQFQWQ